MFFACPVKVLPKTNENTGQKITFRGDEKKVYLLTMAHVVGNSSCRVGNSPKKSKNVGRVYPARAKRGHFWIFFGILPTDW